MGTHTGWAAHPPILLRAFETLEGFCALLEGRGQSRGSLNSSARQKRGKSGNTWESRENPQDKPLRHCHLEEPERITTTPDKTAPVPRHSLAHLLGFETLVNEGHGPRKEKEAKVNFL